MIILIALAAAASAAAPTGTTPAPHPTESEARRVIDRQLAQPPRSASSPALSAEEADAVMTRYLASIGARLDITERAEPR